MASPAATILLLIACAEHHTLSPNALAVSSFPVRLSKISLERTGAETFSITGSTSANFGVVSPMFLNRLLIVSKFFTTKTVPTMVTPAMASSVLWALIQSTILLFSISAPPYLSSSRFYSFIIQLVSIYSKGFNLHLMAQLVLTTSATPTPSLIIRTIPSRRLR